VKHLSILFVAVMVSVACSAQKTPQKAVDEAIGNVSVGTATWGKTSEFTFTNNKTPIVAVQVSNDTMFLNLSSPIKFIKVNGQVFKFNIKVSFEEVSQEESLFIQNWGGHIVTPTVDPKSGLINHKRTY
jgi:hypothetical protein